ncbi:MAG: 4Fe-4S dicluster domain-containing protein [Dehalococcoidia bacterium]|nr:MAG: 4Fe-4S dicluster domain-containing protein [Dehalococcoidia bacterium]
MPKEVNRRDFIKLAAVAASVVTVGQVLPLQPKQAMAASSAPNPAVTLPVGAVSDTSDVLLRMQQELIQALKKPVEQRHWRMVLDLNKCVGCSACTIACVSENKLPPGVVYRPVLDEEIGTYPNVTRRFTPRPCFQCDHPPCVPVCPVNATWKQADGVVVVDYNLCIGCRYCLVACPYHARTSDFGANYCQNTAEAAGIIVGQQKADDYEKMPNFEYGKKWPRKKYTSPIGNARKCHFCLHRVANGMLPACVTTCIGRATYFGDTNDPDSLVSELVSRPDAIRLKEELGTEPSVYYLV